MFAHSIRLSLRALYRAPGHTVVVAVSLGATLAVVSAVIAVVNAYVVRALPFPEADRLYHVMYAPPGPQEPRGMTAIDWAQLGDVVEHAVTSSGDTYYLGDGGPAQTARGLRVSPGFVAALGVRAELGRTFVADDFAAGSQLPVLIGQSLWRDRFASDPTIVGREIRVESEARAGARESFRVVGVLPAGFWFGRDSRERVDMLLPLRAPARTYMVRLKDGVSPIVAERRLTAVAREIGSAFPANWPGVKLESMHDRYVGGMRSTFRTVIAAAALVLLITCANLAVLTLLRAMKRQREMAVRLALGASRGHVLGMFFVEVAIVCGGALVLGLIASAVLLRALSPILDAHLGKPAPGGPNGIALDATVFLVAVVLGLLVALVLAVVAMLAPSASRIPDMLRRASRASTDAPATRRLRAAFVTLEVAGSLALLVGGSLMIRSAIGMFNTDLGYRTDQLVRTRVVLRGGSYPDAASYEQFYETLTARLAVLSTSPAAFANWPPFSSPPPQVIAREDGSDIETGAPVVAVSPGFFTTLAIQLEHGRAFTDADRSGAAPVAIVSQSLARRLWPGENPVGRRLRITEATPAGPVARPWRTVVGVVGDVRQSYSDADLKDVYVPYAQAELGRFGSFYLRSDLPAALVAPRIREIVAAIDPLAIANEPVPVAEQNMELRRARFMTSMLAGLAVFALLVALLGVYGVIAYAVQQREREVAIRVALGATSHSVMTLFLNEGGRLIGAGIALGSFAAVALGRMLQHQLVGVKPFDATAFAVAVVVMALAGNAAVWWPARRARYVSPMAVLNES